MYRSFTADEYRAYLDLPNGYIVSGVICYGHNDTDLIFSLIKECLIDLDINSELKILDNTFLRLIREAKINGKIYWFTPCYGGAMLSEYLHFACLFGSKKNILLGSCGGLKKGIKLGEYIVPTSSFGEESSARIYNRDSSIHFPDNNLAESLSIRLGNENEKVWRGPVVTCQAMIGETRDDVENWSSEGYYGVEMESSTVFAVSSHFNVPSAACVYVTDNLIENHTVLDSSNDGIDSKLQSKLRKTTQIKVAILELIS